MFFVYFFDSSIVRSPGEEILNILKTTPLNLEDFGKEATSLPPEDGKKMPWKGKVTETGFAK